MTDPLSLGGCSLWLDAQQDGLANGDRMATWTDRSGSGNHATQATSGNRPTFRTRGINGLPAVEFIDGSDWFFNLPTMMFDTGSGTTFAVAVPRNLDGVGGFILAQQDLGVNPDRKRWYLWAADTGADIETRGTVGLTASSTAPAPMTAVADQGRTTILGLRSNGTAQRFRSMWPDATDTETHTSTGAGARVVIGKINPDSTSQQWDGYIGEIIHYTSALSDGDMEAVIEYLIPKWRPRRGFRLGRNRFGTDNGGF